MTDDRDDDFAALFAASPQARRLATGQSIEGTIVSIGPEVALVDVGAKGEAALALDELRNEDGVVEARVGDRVQATIVSMSGGITLSRRLQRGAASRRQVEDAFRAGLPVEGRVESQIKGGYDVTIARLRAFCPGSQIDIARDTDPAAHLGRVYAFRIVEFGQDGRRFVVSRRAVQEAEQRQQAEDLRRSLVPGAVVTGRIASVRDFGAFVDLGAGVQGLLHVSEMSWSRVDDPAQLFQPGDQLTVTVLRLESKGGEDRIALGLKQLTGDPWAAVSTRYPVGQAVRGRVTRVADFGVFVELEPGVVGLLPAAESGVAKGADLRKAFPAGTDVDVIVLEADVPGRRLRLSVTAIHDQAEQAEVRDYAARADAAGSGPLTSLADKLRGALGKRNR